ncbi:MAG: phosphoribosylglycinamide formyltransferase [Bacillota bacterium]
MKKRIAVFASGSGSDFQSIIDGVESGAINAEIVMCVASKEGIFAIERAEKHNIRSAVFSLADYNSKAEMFEEIAKHMDTLLVDYIVLAGYLTILPADFVSQYKNRIINIHPALLPKFGGVGFYGMNVHRAVIASGDKVSGATVHFVDSGVDTGAIIAQIEVPVMDDDSAEELQKRVLIAEHKLLPQAIAKVCKP